MNNLCHNAFIGLHIDVAGRIRPCCKYLGNHGPYFDIKDGIEKYTTDIKGQMLQMINSPDAYKEVEASAPEFKKEVPPAALKEMSDIAEEVTDDVPF